MKKAFFTATLFLLASTCAAAEGVHFESGHTQNTLIELYTSDASADCNPALEWISALKDRDPDGLWKRFVPLQFHVSFWDGGGAKDTFAQKIFDDFLLSYKKFWKTRYVYAPTMVVEGTEWGGWSRGQDIPRTVPVPVGVLSADATKREGHFWVQFVPTQKVNPNGLTVHAALLGFGLKSMPSDGPNRGRSLVHDFIVLSHQQQFFKSANGLLTADFEITGKKVIKTEKYAAVFWVTQENGIQPIQVTGGFIKL